MMLHTASDPIYKKKNFKKIIFGSIYNKMSQLLRYSYCLHTPNLVFIFLILPPLLIISKFYFLGLFN